MGKHSLLITTLCYVIILAYGTLYPLQNWQFHAASASGLLQWPAYLSRSDSFINLIIYLPLGFLITLLVYRRSAPLFTILFPTVVGAGLSILLEYGQSFLLTRVSSLADVTLNAFGALFGALAAIAVFSEKFRNNKLSTLINRYFFSSEKTTVILFIVILWLLAELMPLIPSTSRVEFLFGVRPFWFVLNNFSQIDWVRVVNYFSIATVLGLLVSSCLRKKAFLIRWMGVLFIFVIAVKIIIITRQIYLETILGLAIGLLFVSWLPKINSANHFVVVMCVLLILIMDIGVFQVNPSLKNTINWLPFHFQIQGIGFKFSNLIQKVWPYTVLSYTFSCIPGCTLSRTLVCADSLPYTKSKIPKSGLLILFIAISIEWVRQMLFGQYIDITNVILALMGWFIFYFIVTFSSNKFKCQFDLPAK